MTGAPDYSVSDEQARLDAAAHAATHGDRYCETCAFLAVERAFYAIVRHDGRTDLETG